MAAPMPREAPVTSAAPWGRSATGPAPPHYRSAAPRGPPTPRPPPPPPPLRPPAGPAPSRGPPLNYRSAPREPRSERGQQDAVAGAQPSFRLRVRERDGDRGRRRVAEPLDAVHHALR